MRRSPKENLPLLVSRIGSPGLVRFHADLLRAWLVSRHRRMFGTFLEASGIPHTDGFVQGEPPVPTVGHLGAGIARIVGQFEARDVGLYLGYLLLFAGDFWSALPQALDANGIRVIDLLRAGPAAASREEGTPPPKALVESLPEDSDEFTTLDNWLIRTAVASAFGESGALGPDQLEDLVEEVTGLNAQRQHTLFHRGYLHALFGRPLTLHFPGENEDRRLWYSTGAAFGLLRSRKHDQVLRLFRENPDLVTQLCNNRKVRCGSMLLPQVYSILWESGEFGMLQRWIEGQVARMRPDRCAALLRRLHEDSASLVRRGRWAEAEGFLGFLDHFVRSAKGLPEGFAEWILPANDRKRAQALQLKGEFREAESLLRPLGDLGMVEDAGNVLCDRALVAAGFRSLTAVLPGKDEHNCRATVSALMKAKGLLDEAVRRHPSSSTNAHFCLGMIALQTSPGTLSVVDHFQSALAGMLRKEDAYSDGGLIQWTRFLLGLALLETAETADLQLAREYVQQSIGTSLAIPLWLWSRAIGAAALFDDKTAGLEIAGHLLRNRDSGAYRVIWESGLAVSVPELRQTYLAWMKEATLPSKEGWGVLNAMLPAALKDGDVAQAEAILDDMEGMATRIRSCRVQFLALLEDDSNYSPAWDAENADHCRIKFHELEGNLADAAALLRARFFALREAGDPTSLHEASAVLERMADLGADTTDLGQLRSLLPHGDGPSPSKDCRLKDGAPVCVLYIGGNETQAAYESEIRSDLSRHYPGLKVDFYFPGWDSNWNVHLERVRPRLFQADAVVLNRMVRTQFGRSIRALCDSNTPWFPCTGRGKLSLRRSIESAALWAANRRE